MIAIIAQVFGYLASIALAVSLLVNNDIKFRWVNSAGSLCFIIYGALIQAWPVILTNAILLFINIIYLIKLYNREENFDVLEITGDSRLVNKFLEFYKKDISAYFPGFEIRNAESKLSFVVLRDIVIANIFVADLEVNGDAVVHINYTVPKFRDYKVGRFLFERGNNYLVSKGVKRIVYTSVHNPQHERFLKVMGFAKEPLNNIDCYVKSLV